MQDYLAYPKAIYLVSFNSLKANQKPGQRTKGLDTLSEHPKEGLQNLSTKRA